VRTRSASTKSHAVARCANHSPGRIGQNNYKLFNMSRREGSRKARRAVEGREGDSRILLIVRRREARECFFARSGLPCAPSCVILSLSCVCFSLSYCCTVYLSLFSFSFSVFCRERITMPRKVIDPRGDSSIESCIDNLIIRSNASYLTQRTPNGRRKMRR